MYSNTAHQTSPTIPFSLLNSNLPLRLQANVAFASIAAHLCVCFCVRAKCMHVHYYHMHVYRVKAKKLSLYYITQQQTQMSSNARSIYVLLYTQVQGVVVETQSNETHNGNVLCSVNIL